MVRCCFRWHLSRLFGGCREEAPAADGEGMKKWFTGVWLFKTKELSTLVVLWCGLFDSQ